MDSVCLYVGSLVENAIAEDRKPAAKGKSKMHLPVSRIISKALNLPELDPLKAGYTSPARLLSDTQAIKLEPGETPLTDLMKIALRREGQIKQ